MFAQAGRYENLAENYTDKKLPGVGISIGLTRLFYKLKELNLRPVIFTSEEKLGYRMRQAQMRKIPYTIVLGDEELNSDSVTYRKAMQKEQINVSLDEFIAMLRKERDERI